VKPIQMHVYVCDDDGVAFQAKIVEASKGIAEVQLGLLDNIDPLSGAALLQIVVHALLCAPAGAPQLAADVEGILAEMQAMLKARGIREESERRHLSKRPARSKPSLDEDDSEIPF